MLTHIQCSALQHERVWQGLQAQSLTTYHEQSRASQELRYRCCQVGYKDRQHSLGPVCRMCKKYCQTFQNCIKLVSSLEKNLYPEYVNKDRSNSKIITKIWCGFKNYLWSLENSLMINIFSRLLTPRWCQIQEESQMVCWTYRLPDKLVGWQPVWRLWRLYLKLN